MAIKAEVHTWRGFKGAQVMRMNAYYYGFEPTGSEAIDRILSAVATAGKAFHHTEFWSDPAANLGGKKSYIDLIQEAANEAAAHETRGHREWRIQHSTGGSAIPQQEVLAEAVDEYEKRQGRETKKEGS